MRAIATILGALLALTVIAPASVGAAERKPDKAARWGCKFRVGSPHLETYVEPFSRQIEAYGRMWNCEKPRTFGRFEIQIRRDRRHKRDPILARQDYAPVTADSLWAQASMQCLDSWEKVPGNLYARLIVRKKGARNRLVLESENLGKPATRGARENRLCPLPDGSDTAS